MSAAAVDDLDAIETNNADVVLRYLRVFETYDLAELAKVVDPDVVGHGAGQTTHGRQVIEDSVRSPGLSACVVRVDDLFAARDRVTVSFTLTYTRAGTGQQLVMTGTKCYRLRDGRIVELWGETDLYGLLRQAGLVPAAFPPL
jgi:ketosteroid isomerase-like protein